MDYFHWQMMLSKAPAAQVGHALATGESTRMLFT